jgi:hypothetical protein
MKKLMVLSVVLLAAPLGLLVAGEVADSPETPTSEAAAENAAPTGEVNTTTCESPTAQEVVAEWREQQENRTPMGSPPDCPATSDSCATGSTTCLFSGVCALGGEPTTEDTGLSECLDNGELLSCPGHKTVHVTTVPCEQCPCCSAPSPCHCPNDCGAIVTLKCKN